MISIVLPTYNEARSIQEVLRRGSEALRKAGEDHELIVVDDSSPDRTADLAEALANEIPVRVLRRPGRQGLATAVVDGWSIARGDVLGVMDADLQHPPEVLTRLARAVQDPNVDVAIATRSGPGGGAAADWRRTRRLTSWMARHLAACVLPRTLADLSDPMSGMFLVRARALQGVRLEPTGYKILLEVLGKAHYRELVEVPFVFQARTLGSSKLGTRESLQYLAHLARLARSTGQLRSWIRYAAVGFTGAVVNVGVLAFLVEAARLAGRVGIGGRHPARSGEQLLLELAFHFSYSASPQRGTSGRNPQPAVPLREGLRHWSGAQCLADALAELVGSAASPGLRRRGDAGGRLEPLLQRAGHLAELGFAHSPPPRSGVGRLRQPQVGFDRAHLFVAPEGCAGRHSVMGRHSVIRNCYNEAGSSHVHRMLDRGYGLQRGSQYRPRRSRPWFRNEPQG